MILRYLILVATPGGDLGSAGRAAARSLGLAPILAGPRLVILADLPGHCIRIDDRAAIVGTLFRRHGAARRLTALDPGEAVTIRSTGGLDLVRSYWGGWVSALADEEGGVVLRDPSAALACYYIRAPGYCAFASDASLLVDAGLASARIDPGGLARKLYRNGVPAPRTAIAGISELMPGFQLRVAAGAAAQAPCWSPWEHVGPAEEDADVAAQRLRRTITHCVRAWTGAFERPLVSVSGGLDSSIVAAALQPERGRPAAITMYNDDPGGDERIYARALCAPLGLPLREWRYRLAEIDPAEPLAPHLPIPEGRIQALAYERAHRAVAVEVGADAFVTGNGGDSVFGHSQSAAPIADRLLHEGLSRALVATLLDVVRQTGAGLLPAIGAAWRVARGPRGYRCRPETLFLHREALAACGAADLDHPWLDAPSGALPGKAAHIAAILRILHCLEPGRSRLLPVIHPLVSQPVVEACLAIPSWQWRRGGRDRAVARRAFADLVPRVILERRVKGGPSAFAARLLEYYRDEIRTRLLDGQLAALRIVDTGGIEASLARGRIVPGEERVRLLELVAAEAWLEHWRGAGAAARHDLGEDEHEPSG